MSAAPKQLRQPGPDDAPGADWYASYFETRFPFDPRRDVVWREVCGYLQQKYVPPDACVLDLGAGYCNFINNIRAREKHALDLSEIIRQYAQPDVHTHVGPSTDLGMLADDTFDIAFASNLFEHLSRADFACTVSEIRRVLRPGGKLIALQPNFAYCYREYFDDYTHVQIFTHRALADALEAMGFHAFDVQPRFLPVNMKSTLRWNVPLLHLVVRCYLRMPFRPLARQMLVVVQK